MRRKPSSASRSWSRPRANRPGWCPRVSYSAWAGSRIFRPAARMRSPPAAWSAEPRVWTCTDGTRSETDVAALAAGASRDLLLLDAAGVVPQLAAMDGPSHPLQRVPVACRRQEFLFPPACAPLRRSVPLDAMASRARELACAPWAIGCGCSHPDYDAPRRDTEHHRLSRLLFVPGPAGPTLHRQAVFDASNQLDVL